MIGLKRNRQRFYYCLLLRKEPIVDLNGYKTGEYDLIYSEPVEAWANISPSTASAQSEMFGITEPYDRVISPLPVDCQIAEDSILFIDTDVTTDASGKYKYNYIVKQVAKSLNAVSVLAKRVG